MGNRGSADELPVLLNGWREFDTLYVENIVAWVPKSDGSLEEILIDVSGGQQENVPYERSNIVVIDCRLDGCLLKPGWRLAWRQSTMHGFGTTGTVLSRDEGPRLKGVNSLKSGKALWGPNQRSNPNKASGNKLVPSKCPQWSRQAVCTRISSRRGTHARAYATWLESVHLLEERATDAREKESPPPVYNPKVEGQ
ncbi:hypothetical protein CRG98_002670 [Punica granatum]|uniref:Uncharacterized protein n=1 Tax=Punica granatum TaxID=22663 RepID=A0A2I0L8B9_PUNGR|nr:hypothetical protein CRG98_002670 [Punica granatum]